jgi:hypothetical protein
VEAATAAARAPPLRDSPLALAPRGVLAGGAPATFGALTRASI